MPAREWDQPFDQHAISAFLRDGERVFHAYSTYARGADNLGFISSFLHLTPLGRQEPWEEPKGRATAFRTGTQQLTFGTRHGPAGVESEAACGLWARHPATPAESSHESYKVSDHGGMSR